MTIEIDTAYLTHHLGPIELLSGNVRACIECAIAQPTANAFLDGARYRARALAHFGRILQGEVERLPENDGDR